MSALSYLVSLISKKRVENAQVSLEHEHRNLTPAELLAERKAKPGSELWKRVMNGRGSAVRTKKQALDEAERFTKVSTR